MSKSDRYNRSMHWLLSYDLVSDYETRRTALRPSHLAYAQAAFDRGDLALAGALTEPADRALLVFRGDTPKIAEAFAASDPYVVNGLVQSWNVRRWMTVLGDGATPPPLPLS